MTLRMFSNQKSCHNKKYSQGSRKAKVGKYVQRQQDATQLPTNQSADHMVWTTIEKIHLPTILISKALRKRRGALGNGRRKRRSRMGITPGHNFAVAELKEKLPGHSMPVGTATGDMGRLHLTSYNFYDDGNRQKTSDLARLSYRFCDVTHLGKEVIWNNCDADDSSSDGAGIYVMSTSDEPNVKIRQLVAIYTANVQRNGRVQSNQAVRITAFKRGQICLWVNDGDSSRCGGFVLRKPRTSLPRSARTFKKRLPGRRPKSRTEYRKQLARPTQKMINKSSPLKSSNLSLTGNSNNLKSITSYKRKNINRTSGPASNFHRELPYNRKLSQVRTPNFSKNNFRKTIGHSKNLQAEKRKRRKYGLMNKASPQLDSKQVGNKLSKSKNYAVQGKAESLTTLNQNKTNQKAPKTTTSTFIAFKRPKFKRKNFNNESRKIYGYSE